MDLFRIFRDGRPLKGLPSPIKSFPKIACSAPNLKGKVGVWGTPNHPKWDFGVKNGKNQFLTLK